MRKILWGIAVVLALLLVYFLMTNRTGYQSGNLNQSASPSPTTSGKTGGTTVKGLTVTNVTPNLSYTKAIAKYPIRMQIDADCHITPTPNIVLKNGTTVMFDNRAAAAKTLNLDGYKFSLKAYGWSVYTLKSTTLPRKILIDCDKGQQNATITLEK